MVQPLHLDVANRSCLIKADNSGHVSARPEMPLRVAKPELLFDAENLPRRIISLEQLRCSLAWYCSPASHIYSTLSERLIFCLMRPPGFLEELRSSGRWRSFASPSVNQGSNPLRMRPPGFEPGSVACFVFRPRFCASKRVAWKATVLPLDYRRLLRSCRYMQDACVLQYSRSFAPACRLQALLSYLRHASKSNLQR